MGVRCHSRVFRSVNPKAGASFGGFRWTFVETITGLGKSFLWGLFTQIWRYRYDWYRTNWEPSGNVAPKCVKQTPWMLSLCQCIAVFQECSQMIRNRGLIVWWSISRTQYYRWCNSNLLVRPTVRHVWSNNFMNAIGLCFTYIWTSCLILASSMSHRDWHVNIHLDSQLFVTNIAFKSVKFQTNAFGAPNLLGR